MMQFIFGCVVGGAGASLMWVSYIAWFEDDATSVAGQFRRWIKAKLRR